MDVVPEPVTRMVIDWTRCDGHALCVEILPELIGLDDWGYPMVRGPVPPHLLGLAERARGACPVLAIRLVNSR